RRRRGRLVRPVFGQGDGAVLIGDAAIGGVAGDVFLVEFPRHARTGKAGIVAFLVIGPFGGVVAEVDVPGGAGHRLRGRGIAFVRGRKGDRSGLVKGPAIGGVMGNVDAFEFGCHALTGKARIVAFSVISPFGGVVAKVDIGRAVLRKRGRGETGDQDERQTGRA